MGNHELLLTQVREALQTHRGIREQKMFGGICFLHHGNMLCGIDKDQNLMVRVGPEQYEKVMKLKYAREMDITGKPLRGFIFVDRDGWKTASALKKWLDYGLKFSTTLPKKSKNSKKK